MRKRSGFTIIEQAIEHVPEFSTVVRKLEQQVILRGQSKSTLNNYIRRIALFVIHFKSLPEKIDPEEINEYLVALARDPKSPSRSSFKHMVYGLRYYYRILCMNKNSIALPSLKRETKLPVILNQSELKELFAAPTLLKQRIVLALIYSAGLRGQEVINLKISDIDFVRKTIQIRQSKYKKDRIVPLSDFIAKGLKKYLLHTLKVSHRYFCYIEYDQVASSLHIFFNTVFKKVNYFASKKEKTFIYVMAFNYVGLHPVIDCLL